MPIQTTHGIRVSVSAEYLPNASNPDANEFLFAYHIRITNEGGEPAQLLTRHWLIKDALNNVEQVRGEGVIRQQPLLEPGESFSYSSGCPLPTEWGTMRGTYQMIRLNGETFEVVIPPFALLPHNFLN